jgi:hypothetical protein
VLTGLLGAAIGALLVAVLSRPSSSTCPSANQRLFRPDCWDWGDAATWVTGILTAVLVAAAVWQLADARRQEIWRQARAIPVTLHEQRLGAYGEDGDDVDYMMTVHNLSEQPISRVSPLYTAGGYWSAMLERPGDTRYLMPKESFDLRQTLPPDLDFLGVFFIDAADREWVVTLLPPFADRLLPYRAFTDVVVRHDAKERARQHEVERLQKMTGY